MRFDDTLKLCVISDFKAKAVPMLLGGPGIGKSSYAEWLAEQDGTRCFTVPCNQLADKADLTGARLVPTEDGSYKQVFYPHAEIADCVAYALENKNEEPILFLDEINRTTPDVTSELLSIPTARKIGSIRIPDNVRIMIAGNDKGNVISLDEASISRFSLYHVEPDVATYLNLHPDLYGSCKRVLEDHPETIYCKRIFEATDSSDPDAPDADTFIEDIFDGDDGMQQITCPRTIKKLSNWLSNFSNDELMTMLMTTDVVDGVEMNVLQEMIEGHVGHTLFSMFLMTDLASSLTTNTNNNNTIDNKAEVTEPACYKKLKDCESISELNDFISTMSQKEKSNSLVYALYESNDNTHIIQQLAANLDSFESDDLKQILYTIAEDAFDQNNVQVFLETNTPVSEKVQTVLDIGVTA